MLLLICLQPLECTPPLTLFFWPRKLRYRRSILAIKHKNRKSDYVSEKKDTYWSEKNLTLKEGDAH